jgi:hypothetical protein
VLASLVLFPVFSAAALRYLVTVEFPFSFFTSLSLSPLSALVDAFAFFLLFEESYQGRRIFSLL